MNIASNAIDCIHTTAASHGRVFIVEVMGHKVGWLTLHAGIASGADIILLPEIPYDIDKVVDAIEKRTREGKSFSILAVAEGAISKEDAALPKKKLKEKRARAAKLILHKDYGYMVGMRNGEIVKVPLEEVAGKLKMVNPDASIINEAKLVGISFGD